MCVCEHLPTETHTHTLVCVVCTLACVSVWCVHVQCCMRCLVVAHLNAEFHHTSKHIPLTHSHVPCACLLYLC